MLRVNKYGALGMSFMLIIFLCLSCLQQVSAAALPPTPAVNLERIDDLIAKAFRAYSIRHGSDWEGFKQNLARFGENRDDFKIMFGYTDEEYEYYRSNLRRIRNRLGAPEMQELMEVRITEASTPFVQPRPAVAAAELFPTPKELPLAPAVNLERIDDLIAKAFRAYSIRHGSDWEGFKSNFVRLGYSDYFSTVRNCKIVFGYTVEEIEYFWSNHGQILERLRAPGIQELMEERITEPAPAAVPVPAAAALPPRPAVDSERIDDLIAKAFRRDSMRGWDWFVDGFVRGMTVFRDEARFKAVFGFTDEEYKFIVSNFPAISDRLHAPGVGKMMARKIEPLQEGFSEAVAAASKGIGDIDESARESSMRLFKALAAPAPDKPIIAYLNDAGVLVLRTLSSTSREKYVESEECPVTLEPFAVGEEIFLYQCGHAVKNKGWSHDRPCPVCRETEEGRVITIPEAIKK